MPAPKPPLTNALLLWLLTNLSGAGLMNGVLLLFAVWQGRLGNALLMGLFGAMLAAGFSLITIPLAAGLFYLLPRLASFRHRQVAAALGITTLFLLPLLLVAGLFGGLDELLLFALVYWPAALGCAMYLYHPWLFAPAPAAEEPWV
ncbi:hypothetical protein EJV47_11450 [Hymenobacter gummosus]|uniref:Uncharacterized protein n=1 Tax=Hymenobacter gummosus TaxID=1776032 RepID=A0A3S0K623_9BACT|nr:hypothetical protein [Hymenobacter gummosus]RTQ50236.1 hypothetical protein EJV47_11450 [Hymenobacter gummosus]